MKNIELIGNYQSSEQRMMDIYTHIHAYFQATKKISDPSLKKSELHIQYKIVQEKSLLLIGLGLNEEDILRLSEKGNDKKAVEESDKSEEITSESAKDILKPVNKKVNPTKLIEERLDLYLKDSKLMSL